MRHFRVKKTEDLLADHFFWSKMRRDVERYVSRCLGTFWSEEKDA
jgi:hypothetical protein